MSVDFIIGSSKDNLFSCAYANNMPCGFFLGGIVVFSNPTSPPRSPIGLVPCVPSYTLCLRWYLCINRNARPNNSYPKYSFFKHIFKHIKGPLLGLFFITEKCRSEDYQGMLLASAFDWANSIMIAFKFHMLITLM